MSNSPNLRSSQRLSHMYQSDPKLFLPPDEFTASYISSTKERNGKVTTLSNISSFLSRGVLMTLV